MIDPTAGVKFALTLLIVLTLYSLSVTLMWKGDNRQQKVGMVLCAGFCLYALFVIGPDLFALGVLCGTILGNASRVYR